MSTGANNKSLPGTPEFREHYEQIFKDRKTLDADLERPRTERRVYVFRCEFCDHIQLPQGSSRYDCDKCGGKDCKGSIDASIAPPLQESGDAVNSPIMVDRFYEGTHHTTLDEKGQPVTVDLGTRKRHREFMKAKGLTTADDYKGEWAQKQKDRADRENPKLGGTSSERKERREQIERIAYELGRKP